jgi:hypothetical protein
MIVPRLLAAAFTVMALACASSAHAQERVGLAMGYPASVGCCR